MNQVEGIIPHIIDQHVEESAFLWHLRHNAVNEPHYDLQDLIKLDGRVAAHLDGIAVAGEYGSRVCESALENPDAGEVFAAAVRAIEEKNNKRLDHLFSLVNAEPKLLPCLLSAFGWVPAPSLQGIVAELLASDDTLKQLVGVEACVMHRVDPKMALLQSFNSSDLQLCARALRATGELGRVDLLQICERHLDGQADECRFWAAWSAVLLGNRKHAANVLHKFSQSISPSQEQALQLVLKVLPVTDAHALLKMLAQDAANLRHVIRGVGVVGDPYYVPWLMKQMDDPKVARLAGESFSFITGLDLAYLDFECDAPDEVEPGPNDNPQDENVAMDADENLPWPDPVKIQAWWDTNKNNFSNGKRHFMGKHILREHCVQILRKGYQRQRMAAAQYLCLLDPGTQLFPVSAPGWRQKRWLDKLDG